MFNKYEERKKKKKHSFCWEDSVPPGVRVLLSTSSMGMCHCGGYGFQSV